ncbi:MAG: hypothetical protein HKN19_01685 [Halioglobus sp.]|nr:hypothetical protein [Halioglobus sp.]
MNERPQLNIFSPRHPLWGLAFRCGFLIAALFAVAAMLRWLAWMGNPADWDYSLHPTWWHAHEMVFGFALPVVAGFLLTAVANWTGLPGTTGWRLQLLFGLWLGARLILWLAPGQYLLAWQAEMLFLLFLTWELGQRVWARRQWRNLLFIPVLLLLALLCSASYMTADDPMRSRQLNYGATWMIAVLVTIVGGRIIPLFTGNRLGRKITPLPAAFDYLVIATTLVIGLAFATVQRDAAAPWLSPLCLLGALLHGIRLARWQGWRTLRIPLLWSLHLSYACIPLALLGLGLYTSNGNAVMHLMHLLAIASIGGMILAVMSRVALGHTGRPLEVPTSITIAFATVIAAALVRALGPIMYPAATLVWWRLAGALWIVAFALFLWRYLPILTTRRADGKPG